MKKFACAILSFSVLGFFMGNASLAADANNCDRQCLKDMTEQYFVALASQDHASLPFSEDVKYSENGSLLVIGEGHWAKITGKDTYRLQIFDVEQGGIGLEVVVPTAAGQAVMVLRLKVEDKLITEVESVIAYPELSADSWLFAPEELIEPSYFWTWSIRESERDTRHSIIAAAESYFRAFVTEGTLEYERSDALLPDTMRVEMGKQTTTSGDRIPDREDGIPVTATEQFDNAKFKGMTIYDRHYPVVDTETGTVLAMVRFGTLADEIVGEFFAVTGGKIREIQAVFATAEEGSEPVW